MTPGIMRLIEERSVPEGSHRVWTGALHEKTPVARVPGFRNLIAVRRLMLLDFGPPEPGVLSIAKCGNPLCVKREHVRGASRRVLQRITTKVNPHQKSPSRNAKIAAKAKKKFTPDQVEQILLDPRPQRAIAKDWGVSQSSIGDIKSGKSHKHRAGNPFAGLGARQSTILTVASI